MSAFSNFFGKIGHGLSSAARTVGNGFSSIAKPIAGFASQYMPAIGSGIGGMLGGPMGMQVGSMLGGSAGNMLSGISQGHNPTASSFMPSQENMQQLAQMGSGYLNQLIPEQYRNMSIGQMANNFSNAAGNRVNQMLPQSLQGYGLGSHFSNFMNNQFNSRVPQHYRDQNLSGAVYRYGSGGQDQPGDSYAPAGYNNAGPEPEYSYAEGGPVGYEPSYQGNMQQPTSFAGSNGVNSGSSPPPFQSQYGLHPPYPGWTHPLFARA